MRLVRFCSAPALVCAALAFAPAADASHLPPRHGFGTTDCYYQNHPIEPGAVVGLATDMPRMYAVNYRRNVRDRQRVFVRTDLWYWNGVTWTRLIYGDWYGGWASDNSSAKVFFNDRTGKSQLQRDRLQFVFRQSGFYQVAQQLLWKRNERVPRYTAPYTSTYHYPGEFNGTMCAFR